MKAPDPVDPTLKLSDSGKNTDDPKETPKMLNSVKISPAANGTAEGTFDQFENGGLQVKIVDINQDTEVDCNFFMSGDAPTAVCAAFNQTTC